MFCVVVLFPEHPGFALKTSSDQALNEQKEEKGKGSVWESVSNGPREAVSKFLTSSSEPQRNEEQDFPRTLVLRREARKESMQGTSA